MTESPPPPENLVLIFGLCTPLQESQLPPFQASTETLERQIVYEPIELAFDLHTKALKKYFDMKKQNKL